MPKVNKLAPYCAVLIQLRHMDGHLCDDRCDMMTYFFNVIKSSDFETGLYYISKMSYNDLYYLAVEQVLLRVNVKITPQHGSRR